MERERKPFRRSCDSNMHGPFRKTHWGAAILIVGVLLVTRGIYDFHSAKPSRKCSLVGCPEYFTLANARFGTIARVNNKEVSGVLAVSQIVNPDNGRCLFFGIVSRPSSLCVGEQLRLFASGGAEPDPEWTAFSNTWHRLQADNFSGLGVGWWGLSDEGSGELVVWISGGYTLQLDSTDTNLARASSGSDAAPTLRDGYHILACERFTVVGVRSPKELRWVGPQ